MFDKNGGLKDSVAIVGCALIHIAIQSQVQIQVLCTEATPGDLHVHRNILTRASMFSVSIRKMVAGNGVKPTYSCSAA